MRKAIILVLLIVLGTLPLQTSAQVSVPAVDLYCTNLDGENKTGDAGPLAWIDVYAPQPLLPNGTPDPDANWFSDTVSCTLSNPNSYVERIQIQISADGLIAYASNGSTITLAPNGEESFNVIVESHQAIGPSVRTLRITATVVEANGSPPPNIAESQVTGEIHLSTSYGPNGCSTFAENGFPITIPYDNMLFKMMIEHRLPWNRPGPEPGNWLEMNTHEVVLRMNASNAPLHAANFYTLTVLGCYNDMSFHRVIDDFMIQSGDFETGNGTGGNAAFWAGYCNGQAADQTGVNYTAQTCPNTQWTLPDETNNGLTHKPGSLAMAKTSVPNSAGSQFYIVPSDSTPSHLDGIHTVFGEVVKGMHFVDYISEVETTPNDRPVHDVIVTKTVIVCCMDSDGDGLPDDIDDYPNDANETEDSDGDGVGDNFDQFPYDPTKYEGDSDGDGTPDSIDDFPNDANETTDSDGDGVGDNSDEFPDDPDETHDDDGDGVGNNTDEFPQDPDEQFDNDGDGVGNNADDFPDNKYASNWSTIYAAVGTLIVLLIGAGVMISRMKQEDELPNVPATNDFAQIEKQIQELERMKAGMLEQQDPTELMFED